MADMWRQAAAACPPAPDGQSKSVTRRWAKRPALTTQLARMHPSVQSFLAEVQGKEGCNVAKFHNLRKLFDK
jgi:hypothetical protein